MTRSMTRVVAIGECMVELTRRDASTLALGFAGDVFNTAVYLKRLAGAQAEVRFLTAVGDDSLSADQLVAMREAGIAVDAQRVAGASPALYVVSTDDTGERSFTYYRESSPVRRLFDGEIDPSLVAGLRTADLVYFSAITLQQLTETGRGILLALVGEARGRGATVAFDSNYRAAGWPSPGAARDAVARASAVTDIALPSVADERDLYGGGGVAEVVARYLAAGVREVVVKDGPGPVVVEAAGARRVFAGASVDRPVDTTGAGDSFNAAYLWARLCGQTIEDAVAHGRAVASVVVAHPGAIVDRQVALPRGSVSPVADRAPAGTPGPDRARRREDLSPQS